MGNIRLFNLHPQPNCSHIKFHWGKCCSEKNHRSPSFGGNHNEKSLLLETIWRNCTTYWHCICHYWRYLVVCFHILDSNALLYHVVLHYWVELVRRCRDWGWYSSICHNRWGLRPCFPFISWRLWHWFLFWERHDSNPSFPFHNNDFHDAFALAKHAYCYYGWKFREQRPAQGG